MDASGRSSSERAAHQRSAVWLGLEGAAEVGQPAGHELGERGRRGGDARGRPAVQVRVRVDDAQPHARHAHVGEARAERGDECVGVRVPQRPVARALGEEALELGADDVRAAPHEVGLRREVAEEAAAADARGLRDVGHAHGVVPALGEQADGHAGEVLRVDRGGAAEGGPVARRGRRHVGNGIPGPVPRVRAV
nr:hypothetical protein [Clavibacter michiganensis]